MSRCLSVLFCSVMYLSDLWKTRNNLTFTVYCLGLLQWYWVYLAVNTLYFHSTIWIIFYTHPPDCGSSGLGSVDELRSLNRPGSVDGSGSLDGPGSLDIPGLEDGPASVDEPGSVDRPGSVDALTSTAQHCILTKQITD